VVAVALAACGRGDSPARSRSDDAARAARAPVDAAAPDAGPPLPAHRTFSTVGAAIAAIVPADARVLGFGELHVRTDRPGVRPPLVVFRDDVLPTLGPTLSDLVLETWVVDTKCGEKGKQATKAVETAMKRPAQTKDDLGETVAAAKAAGIQVHAMTMTCKDYERVAPKSGAQVEVDVMLDLVTRELGRIAASAVVYRDKEKHPRPRIALYGGALHNDRFPYDSVKQWSYAAGVDKVASDHYVEIDLFAPELAAADALYQKEDWFPLVSAAAPGTVLVYDRGERSFVVILPPTVDK
jgi:hypothetical protein